MKFPVPLLTLLFQTAVFCETNPAAALDAKGQAEFQAGRYQPAKVYFERALKVLPNEPMAQAAGLANLGQAHQALGSLARAEQLYRQAIDRLPTSAHLYQLLGKALLAQTRYRDAEAAYQRALALKDPKPAITYNDLALLYQAQRKTARALEYLHLAISASPAGRARATMLTNLGGLEFQNGAKADAAQHLAQALGEMEQAVGPKHPDTAKVLELYAAVLQKSGQKDQAKDLARRAQDIRSSFASQANTLSSTVDYRDLK